jgi:asparagine synthase (glutamine-hydrolysing)
MCGIAGILTTRTDLDLAPPLAAMTAALRHRGPDDEGVAEIALPGGVRLGLAQTRLAILDLSPAGHQPMTDEASGSWIVYNGEVYNHLSLRKELPHVAFRSTSDTETILHGWLHKSEQVLSSLRGMFAFALYDGRRRRFWLVRDRLGVKPLYACRAAPEVWLFASELRALLASGLVERRLQPEAVAAYLAFGAVVAPATMLAGVASLRPAEAWCFALDDVQLALTPQCQLYWTPPFAANGTTVRREEAVERLRPVLREAAGLRMLADVPVGVFLSGGIDSSSLVALLAHQGYTPHTFSVVFGDSPYDESQYSRLIAAHFGAKHHELHLDPAGILADFEPALAAYDQPSIDGINTYHIAKATRRAGIKVALSGLGGDELFAGYSYFRLAARLEGAFGWTFARLAQAWLRWFAPGSAKTVKLGQLLRLTSRVARYGVLRQVLSEDRRLALRGGKPSKGESLLPEDVADALEKAVQNLDPINAHSLLELSLYLANMLLRDTDQMSMAHALEVREPLLDHVLVETVAALPGHLKRASSSGHRLKALLLEALPAPLPRAVLDRPKMGFVLPWEEWLRGPLKATLADIFATTAAIRAAGLDPAGVQQVWNGFLAHQPGVRYADVLCLAHLIYWVCRHRLEALAV